MPLRFPASSPLPSARVVRLTRRLVLSGLPALILVALALSTVFGEEGLLHRQALRAELAQANAVLAAIERDNQRLLLELAALERDPIAIERAVADEIRYGAEGAVLYVFGPDAGR